MSFAERFNVELQRGKWTLEGLARAMIETVGRKRAVNYTTLSRYKTGERVPNIERAEAIAMTMGVPIDKFVEWRPSEGADAAEAKVRSVIKEIEAQYGVTPETFTHEKQVPGVGYVPGLIECGFNEEGYPVSNPLGSIPARVEYPLTWRAVVKGDTLAPTLRDGWTLYFAPEAKWKDGDIVGVKLSNGTLTVGTIHKTEDGYILGSLNPALPPQAIKKVDEEFVQRLASVEMTDQGERV